METLTILLTILFWSSVAMVGYSYAVYPVLLKLLARGKHLPEERFRSDDEFPEVAVLLAVYNEEAVLEKTLASILASNYPEGKMTVRLGSDGSTDRSHEIVERFQAEHPELHLDIFGGRNGKIRIVNRLAEDAMARFENPESAIFVLCDANVEWSPLLLRTMVSHFRREKVGLVGANVIDARDRRDGIGEQEDAYIGRENLTKYHEGVLWGNVMGAFGACYSMRARLFRKIPEHYIVDDFFLTMSCLEQGTSAIVDLEAECYEAVSSEIGEEFRRKRRIATGNFQNLRHFWSFLLPWRNFVHSFAFWSHKGLRWVGPLLILASVLTCFVLANLQPIYWFVLFGFMVTLSVAVADQVLCGVGEGIHVKLFRFVRYFYSMNAALFLGFLAFCKGVRNSVWEPTRRVVSDPDSPLEI